MSRGAPQAEGVCFSYQLQIALRAVTNIVLVDHLERDQAGELLQLLRRRHVANVDIVFQGNAITSEAPTLVRSGLFRALDLTQTACFRPSEGRYTVACPSRECRTRARCILVRSDIRGQ